MSTRSTDTMNASAGQVSTATFQYVVDESWIGFGGIHGGLLAAMLTAASRQHVPGAMGVVSLHMFAPVSPGELTVETSVVHGGRTASVAAAIDGSVTGLLHILRSGHGASVWPREQVVERADPAGLPRLDVPLAPFAQHLDIRPINDARPLAGGPEAEFDVWIRLQTPTLGDWSFSQYDVAAILLDALAPALYATMTAPVPIPTIELTAHLAPASFDPSSWMRLRHRASWATAHLCVDETELFTPAGELAAQARQLRRITGPSDHPHVRATKR